MLGTKLSGMSVSGLRIGPVCTPAPVFRLNKVPGIPDGPSVPSTAAFQAPSQSLLPRLANTSLTISAVFSTRILVPPIAEPAKVVRICGITPSSASPLAPKLVST